MSGILNAMKGIFQGPTNQVEVPMNQTQAPTQMNVPTNTRTNTRTGLNNFRNRNSGVKPIESLQKTTLSVNSASDPTLSQSGGKRTMRSKTKSLRPLLFLKYKYKMARRSMTMRKGRKGRKGTRRASRMRR